MLLWIAAGRGAAHRRGGRHVDAVVVLCQLSGGKVAVGEQCWNAGVLEWC